MAVNTAAAITVTACGAATIAAVVLASQAVSTVAIVALATLATLAAALSIASVTAFFDEGTVGVGAYFENVGKHAKAVIPTMVTFVAQTLFQALVQGLGKKIERSMNGGADVVVKHI